MFFNVTYFTLWYPVIYDIYSPIKDNVGEFCTKFFSKFVYQKNLCVSDELCMFCFR
jgi:hypothetical protein